MTEKTLKIDDDAEYQVAQAMDYLGVKHRLTIKRWADSGKLPFHMKPARPKPWMMFWGRDLKRVKRLMNPDAENRTSYLPTQDKRGRKPGKR